MRKSSCFLGVVGFGAILLIVMLFIYPRFDKPSHAVRLRLNRELVRTLQLTDLCLFTEARYTRHLSQADLHSAFQDHPLSFEHFPSGALTLPPQRIHSQEQHR